MITCERTVGGTNNLLGGQPPGTGILSPACLTCSSISHVTAPTTQEDSRIVEELRSEASGEHWLAKASGLTFLDPGRYDRMKLNQLKKRAHLACLELSLLAERMYCRFLWSVQTRNCCSAPSNQCHHPSSATFTASNFAHIIVPFRGGTVFGRGRHTGGVCYPLGTIGTGQLPLPPQRHPPQPQTAGQDQEG